MTDKKISALTDLGGAPASTDVLPIVDSSANQTKKVSVEDLFTNPNVTGTLTSDGLTVDGDVSISDTSVILDLMETDTTDVNTRIQHSSGDLLIRTLNDAKSAVTTRLAVDHATGDISFYEDTGTTAKFFWDASAESLGIGTTSPSAPLSIGSVSGDTYAIFDNGTKARLTFNGDASAAKIFATTTGFANYEDLEFRADNYLFKTGTTEVMRLDSSGNLLVGKSANNFATEGFQVLSDGRILSTVSGDQPLALNRLSSDGAIAEFYKDDTIVGSIGVKTPAGNDGELIVGSTDCALRFRTPSSGTAFISPVKTDATLLDGAMNLGDPDERFKDLYLSGGIINPNGDLSITQQGASNDLIISSDRSVRIFTSSSERMRIDSSGNLLVSTTDTSPATNNIEGICLRNEGHINISRASGVVGYFNRKTDDGDIIRLLKDGTTVGSIGVSNSGTDLVIDATRFSNRAGLRFRDSSLYPRQNATDADGLIDLGGSAARFKDLYLSGGVVFGSTGGAVTSKTLDDYEEGTWTPAISASTAPTSVTHDIQNGYYTKIGRLVTVQFDVSITAWSGGSSFVVIENLPFVTNQAIGSGTLSAQNIDFNSLSAINYAVNSRGSSATDLIIIYDRNDNSSNNLLAGHLSGDERFRGTFSYTTNS